MYKNPVVGLSGVNYLLNHYRVFYIPSGARFLPSRVSHILRTDFPESFRRSLSWTSFSMISHVTFSVIYFQSLIHLLGSKFLLHIGENSWHKFQKVLQICFKKKLCSMNLSRLLPVDPGAFQSPWSYGGTDGGFAFCLSAKRVTTAYLSTASNRRG